MGDDHQTNVPLLEDSTEILHPGDPDKDQNSEDIVTRVWIESKKLWQIVGPAVLSRISTYSVIVISQVFAGHLGDLDLAAVSIALNVIIGFDFGLMVLTDIQNSFQFSSSYVQTSPSSFFFFFFFSDSVVGPSLNSIAN